MAGSEKSVGDLQLLLLLLLLLVAVMASTDKPAGAGGHGNTNGGVGGHRGGAAGAMVAQRTPDRNALNGMGEFILTQVRFVCFWRTYLNV